MDRKFFYFRREPESETSVSFSDTGVGLSTIAIPSENLTFITAGKGRVIFTFKDCNGFDESNLIQGESVPKANITVSCKEGAEGDLIESVINFMSRDTPKNIMKFDVVTNTSTFKEAVVDTVNDVISVVPSTPVNTATKDLSRGDSTHEAAQTIAGIYFNESKPVIDYNHDGLTSFSNATSVTAWANAGTAGSNYDLTNNLGTTNAVTEATEETLIKKAATLGSTNSFLLSTAYTISDDYTIYAVFNTNGIANNSSYGIGAIYGDVAGGAYGFGSRPRESGRITSSIFDFSRDVFAVRHSKTDAGAISANNILTGYAAFVDTKSTADGTKSFRVPDPDPSSPNYEPNNVFIIRRDKGANMYLHNRDGDLIAKIPAKSIALDPSLTNSSSGRTDGDLVLGSIGEVGGSSSSGKLYLNRFGVINRDVGPNEAANLAKQLLSLYGKK